MIRKCKRKRGVPWVIASPVTLIIQQGDCSLTYSGPDVATVMRLRVAEDRYTDMKMAERLISEALNGTARPEAH